MYSYVWIDGWHGGPQNIQQSLEEMSLCHNIVSSIELNAQESEWMLEAGLQQTGSQAILAFRC